MEEKWKALACASGRFGANFSLTYRRHAIYLGASFGLRSTPVRKRGSALWHAADVRPPERSGFVQTSHLRLLLYSGTTGNRTRVGLSPTSNPQCGFGQSMSFGSLCAGRNRPRDAPTPTLMAPR